MDNVESNHYASVLISVSNGFQSCTSQRDSTKNYLIIFSGHGLWHLP